jgi:hypothetical protein
MLGDSVPERLVVAPQRYVPFRVTHGTETGGLALRPPVCYQALLAAGSYCIVTVPAVAE